MSYRNFTMGAALTALLCFTACTRQTTTSDANRSGDANRVAPTDAQHDRDQDVAKLEKRLDDVDRKWSDKESKLAQERAKATAAMRTEVRQDIKNAREAVENLKTTTPENWWDREEGVLDRTTAELEHDVQRFTGRPLRNDVSNRKDHDTQKDTAFALRRDHFIDSLQPRVNAMKKQMDAVSAKGTENTERNDTLDRVKKLDSDLSELRKASPDDWWKISRDRVSDYIDRLEKSVNRLDDNKS